MTTSTPYGAWTSPITTDVLVAAGVRLSTPQSVAGGVCWFERRPTEGGRTAIVRREPDGTVTDLAPPPFNARTRVHEYGGGAVTFAPDGTVYASSFEDQRVHRISPGSAPVAVTRGDGLRYADGAVDAARGRLVCV